MMQESDHDTEKDTKEDAEDVKEGLVDKDAEYEKNAEWALLLAVIDRIFLFLYLLAVLVLIIYFLSHAHINTTTLDEDDDDDHTTSADDAGDEMEV